MWMRKHSILYLFILGFHPRIRTDKNRVLVRPYLVEVLPVVIFYINNNFKIQYEIA